jgi:hypothetical protein
MQLAGETAPKAGGSTSGPPKRAGSSALDPEGLAEQLGQLTVVEEHLLDGLPGDRVGLQAGRGSRGAGNGAASNQRDGQQAGQKEL